MRYLFLRELHLICIFGWNQLFVCIEICLVFDFVIVLTDLMDGDLEPTLDCQCYSGHAFSYSDHSLSGIVVGMRSKHVCQQ